MAYWLAQAAAIMPAGPAPIINRSTYEVGVDDDMLAVDLIRCLQYFAAVDIIGCFLLCSPLLSQMINIMMPLPGI